MQALTRFSQSNCYIGLPLAQNETNHIPDVINDSFSRDMLGRGSSLLSRNYLSSTITTEVISFCTDVVNSTFLSK